VSQHHVTFFTTLLGRLYTGSLEYNRKKKVLVAWLYQKSLDSIGERILSRPVLEGWMVACRVWSFRAFG